MRTIIRTKVMIVAELGLNHGGNLDTALKMVEIAADCGCDAIKVQAIRPEDFLPEGHNLWRVTEECWLGWDGYRKVMEETQSLGLRFGATPSSVHGVAELASMGVDYLKNSSDYLLRHDMIRAMSETGLPTVVSTGMATSQEIWGAVRAFGLGNRDRLTLMHCTSAYPCPDDEVNLARLHPGMGFSDHTEGWVAAIVAVARGATMIEKHFTLDSCADGPDHHFSAEPHEMTWLVDDVRRAERQLGSRKSGPTPSELEHRDAWRVTEGTVRAG